jgi:hypothetical protein
LLVGIVITALTSVAIMFGEFLWDKIKNWMVLESNKIDILMVLYLIC